MAENDIIPIKRTTVELPDFVAKSAASQKQETKYPTEIIRLPTKGWFYPTENPLSSGEIEIKQMSAKEEDILANQDLINKGKALDKLIESLVVDKSIDPSQILIPDKNAIFIGIRRLAYGDNYPVKVTCPQCAGEQQIKIDLSKLENKPFNFDGLPKGQNQFAFKLPNSGITITYKFLNQIDELSIDGELTQLKKLSKESSNELTTRLKYLITSVDGKFDKSAVRKFVDSPQFSARDSLALRKHIKENTPDIDMTFDFKCEDPKGKGCEYERRSDVPIGASFLWPDIDD